MRNYTKRFNKAFYLSPFIYLFYFIDTICFSKLLSLNELSKPRKVSNLFYTILSKWDFRKNFQKRKK